MKMLNYLLMQFLSEGDGILDLYSNPNYILFPSSFFRVRICKNTTDLKFYRLQEKLWHQIPTIADVLTPQQAMNVFYNTCDWVCVLGSLNLLTFSDLKALLDWNFIISYDNTDSLIKRLYLKWILRNYNHDKYTSGNTTYIVGY